jgi:ketosteroid isomerase-like protein
MRRTTLAAVIALVSAACASPPAPSVPAFDPAEIRAAEASVIAALESDDPTAWVYEYTEDAVVLEAGSPPVRGRAALLDMARAMTPMSSVRIVPEHTEGDGRLAYMRGTASWVNGRPSGTTTRVQALMVWRKEADGKWRMAHEVLVPEP